MRKKKKVGQFVPPSRKHKRKESRHRLITRQCSLPDRRDSIKFHEKVLWLPYKKERKYQEIVQYAISSSKALERLRSVELVVHALQAYKGCLLQQFQSDSPT